VKKLIICCTLIVSLLVISGCAGMSTYTALPNEPRGVRVYPPKIYLLVDKDKTKCKLVSLPDFKNAYDVKPWAFLSKHDFTIKIEGGKITELTSNQDTSAALTLLQKLAELAAEKAPGPKGPEPSAIELDDVTFGFESGIYELTEAGFKKVHLVPEN
jgi:hypothetical protein